MVASLPSSPLVTTVFVPPPFLDTLHPNIPIPFPCALWLPDEQKPRPLQIPSNCFHVCVLCACTRVHLHKLVCAEWVPYPLQGQVVVWEVWIR